MSGIKMAILVPQVVSFLVPQVVSRIKTSKEQLSHYISLNNLPEYFRLGD